ncbi:ABC transporter substrate-binding protein [Rhizobium sp. L1K21]|uniref:ABC transporter substrate-binding protein n=1 Tax=Rhizobium sp. L1K21 TaxID=2954933 RepID=UPI00209255D0|nr:ABC transporter substrate-binding protein [Rhizobium sp. L1K21]MCO6188317.1 ABC transporter substrate-binding protein [Rhizobium sp. L1K21]
MKKSMKMIAAALMAGSAMLAAQAANAQGVTDKEVVIGSNQDMSGIFAAFGAPAVKAAQLYFDKVNANGGVHGRQIKFVVEDHGYQMPKAMQALNKLVNSDQIFAMLLQLGTPMNIASFPILESKQVANIAPLTSARQMVEPASPYKYAGFSSYYDQARLGLKYLSENEGAKKICSMYIPSDFGNEIKEGTDDAVKEYGLELVAETTHKPDEQDFVGSLTKLKDAGCDTITIALGVRQIITAVATAKKMGWNDVKFLGSSAGFHTAIAKVPGGVTEGYWAGAGWSDIVARMDNPTVKAWVDEYQAATGEFPSSGALLGRSAAETLVRALEAAGQDLTPESFQKGMESLEYDDEIAGVHIKFGPDDHIGGDPIVISKIEGGDWKEIATVDPSK